MADLLIKDMEMPECCYGCPLVYDMGEGNYACSFRHGYAPLNERRDDCPLVELPPHGRLIDADALEAKIKRLAIADYPFDALGCCGVVVTAPTVMEASE